jgi:hypothetical protein
MKRIMQANIDKFSKLLETETDATKRAMLTQLLSEERDKLKALTTSSARGVPPKMA